MGLKYLHLRRWMRRLCLLYKFLSTKQSSHSSLPQIRNSYRHPNTFNAFLFRTEYFKNLFSMLFIYGINLIQTSAPLIVIFRNALLKFIRPLGRKIFDIYDPSGTRLRLGFSHLHEHKFIQGFKDTLNPLCSCSIAI